MLPSRLGLLTSSVITAMWGCSSSGTFPDDLLSRFRLMLQWWATNSCKADSSSSHCLRSPHTWLSRMNELHACGKLDLSTYDSHDTCPSLRTPVSISATAAHTLIFPSGSSHAFATWNTICAGNLNQIMSVSPAAPRLSNPMRLPSEALKLKGRLPCFTIRCRFAARTSSQIQEVGTGCKLATHPRKCAL